MLKYFLIELFNIKAHERCEPIFNDNFYTNTHKVYDINKICGISDYNKLTIMTERAERLELKLQELGYTDRLFGHPIQ